jgi:ribonuclease D
MADEKVRVVVHGGQAEVRFCLNLGGKQPANVIDLQIAEGLRSRSYPLAYATLVARVVGAKVAGKETRTDWRRRPLSKQQVHYALEDVNHVLPVWEKQQRWLKRRGRLSWVESECDRFVAELVEDNARPPYERINGLHRLTRRELAALEALADWRDREARAKNRPVRRILRDDLLIELARRQPETEKDLLATRDMNRGDYRRNAPDMLAAIKSAMEIPEKKLPKRVPRQDTDNNQDEQVIGQLLGIALANRCAEQDVARPLVGTSADLRHLVRWHVYGEKDGPPPRLTEGWRAEVCGDLLEDVLDGKIALRVADASSDHPLIFERVADSRHSHGRAKGD